jgi:hypothetical protein
MPFREMYHNLKLIHMKNLSIFALSLLLCGSTYGQSDSIKLISEVDLDNSVKWIQEMNQSFPEDEYGFGEHGLVQASDKPIPYEIAKLGIDKNTNKTVILLLSLNLKSTAKTQAGEFEFSTSKREKQTNLTFVQTPSGEVTLYRQNNLAISSWQRSMIGPLLRISNARITNEDADFLNNLQ